MSAITKYYCDVCGLEDPDAKAWSFRPTMISTKHDLNFMACDSCLDILKDTLTSFLEHRTP